MTESAEVIEGHAEEVGVELEPRATQTLWKTDDPTTVLEKATQTANALAPVLRDKGMLAQIQGRDYVLYEGWVTLGSMLGVTPVGVWTRRVDNGWEARVNAQTLDGRVIGSAESMCLATEENWKDSDEFAIRSMAQTRAASKALASVLRFVVTLAGMEGTPAEEMQRDRDAKGGAGHPRSDSDPATQKQRQWILGEGTDRPGLLEKSNFSDEELAAITAWSNNDQGKLTKKAASFLIENLKDGSEQGRLTVLNAAMPMSDVPIDESGL